MWQLPGSYCHVAVVHVANRHVANPGFELLYPLHSLKFETASFCSASRLCGPTNAKDMRSAW